MPKALPGFSGGKSSVRSRAEEKEDKVRKVEHKVMHATLAKEQRETDAAVGDVAWKAASEVDSAIRWSTSQSWDCSQVDEDLEERDGMEWYEDDEMLRQSKKR